MKNKGILIVISGPSGTGKSTIVSELLKQQPNIHLSVSATTRNPRVGEQHGEQYYFISTDEFEAEIKNNGMLEHAVYCNNYYGTPKKTVLEMLEKGKDVILEIEVQGALKIKQQYNDAVFVFVVPPDMKELKSRLIGRATEKNNTINQRLKTAEKEISFIKQYDYIVINDTIEKAIKKINTIIQAEKLKVSRMRDFTL